MFAGVSTIALLMPTRAGDDAVNLSTTGTQWGQQYVNNVSSSIAGAWRNTINLLTSAEGSPCVFGGGGRGFSGCGAFFTMSAADSASQVAWYENTEGWGGIIQNGNDALSNTYTMSAWTCNYNCNTVGFVLP
jgi:hypothetical protein